MTLPCWKRVCSGVVINLYRVVGSLLRRCVRVGGRGGEQDQIKEKGSANKKKNERGHSCLSLRKMRNPPLVSTPAEITNTSQRIIWKLLREKASELSDNTVTSKQALVFSGPLSLWIRI